MKTVTGYRQGVPFDLEVVPIDEDGHSLATTAAEAFVLMREAAAEDGITLIVNTAFRDMTWQDRLYEEYKHKLADWMAGTEPRARPKPPPVARPGRSPHQSGVAVDLNRSHDGGETDRWLAAHAGKFGFVRTLEVEPWHWEFRPMHG